MISIKTLHILNKLPDHNRYRLCLAAIGPEDGLLFIENGVLAITQAAPEVLEIAAERRFVLGPDLEARGLSGQTDGPQTVSFSDMVKLTASADRVISW